MGVECKKNDTERLIFKHMEDPKSQWSIGTFGAIAEFSRIDDEPIIIQKGAGSVSAITSRGAIQLKIPGNCKVFASESMAWQGWSQRLSLCLARPQAAMSGRSVITELGEDRHALRLDDRKGVLFDIGLAAPHVDFCIRVTDPDLKKILRECEGRSLFDEGERAFSAILKCNPHRVFVSRVGRVEVFQRIPNHGERSPDGPHTHVLLKLLRRRKTHAATEPVPNGFLPCAHIYPWHPADVALGKSPFFHEAQHDYFQNILRSFGDPHIIAIKDDVVRSIASGAVPSAKYRNASRMERSAIRVTLRQLKAKGLCSEALDEWISTYDRSNREIAIFDRGVCDYD